MPDNKKLEALKAAIKTELGREAQREQYAQLILKIVESQAGQARPPTLEEFTAWQRTINNRVTLKKLDDGYTSDQ